jgi:DNA-directed RNA polymerase subunit beta'
MELHAPDVIVRNEKRMLQEAVDALFDNGRRGRVLRGTNNRPLKSLSDTLKGKQGRFRQNLLGKRVDYSGRSVIVVGPELKLHQCGLPKKMALELFKPFIYHRLEAQGHCTTIKQAKEMVEQQDAVVWDILEEVIREHPVLLNRAPTLHRLGIQAFEPTLVEGKAIRIHPLVCTAFNADFDGDQMAVHIPLSPESQVEASVLMLSANNILSPANGLPLAVPTQDMVLGIYYLTKGKPGAKGEGRAFGLPEEVVLALEAGEVELLTPIRLRYEGEFIDLSTAYDDQDVPHAEPVKLKRQFINTTVGRVIFNDHLPEEMPYINGLLKKKGVQQLCYYCYLRFGLKRTVQMLDELKELGFFYATQSGISIGIDDMVIPADKAALVENTEKEVVKVQQQYLDGAITNGERYNKVIAIWSDVTEKVAEQMFKAMEQQDKEGIINPIYVMADSGARGSKQQIRQLSGMRGLMAKPSGEVIETPITSNFREGLTVLQYFISTHGARKGLADTALKTADSGYLTRRLVDVAQDVIISEFDCGTADGIFVEPIVEAGVEVEPLRDRVVGRVSLEKIKDYEGNVIVDVNQEITEELANSIQAAGIERVKIRSVLTCESRRGACARCYGRNLATGRMVEMGEAVGVIGAQSIGEPGTQLTMRTFHIGGTATRVTEQSKLEARNSGLVRFIDLNKVRGRGNHLIAMNRNGLVAIVDEKGREKERYHVVYGARLQVEENQPVKLGDILAEWDPYTFSILTEAGGTVQFKDLQPGITIEEQVDEVTGLSQLVVTLPPGDEKHQPTILIRDSAGRTRKKYLMPSRAHLMVQDGDEVQPGDVLAKIPRETTKTKDITGGLPRVVELFETRKPRDPAVISEIDGVVRYGEISKGQRKIYVESEDGKTTKEYSIARGVHINVQEGEHVGAGEPLIDGPLNPHDLLAVLGEKYTQAYLVNSIQEVYRLQGVNINDKHIETIVRQMMRWVKVEDVGDTSFLLEEQVDKFRFREENDRIISDGGRPATGRPLLLGITKASLSTDSFISAASFQETTRVLTEAAVAGKVDYLRGLKENVIMGRLIPAGTGLERYRNIELLTEVPPPPPEEAIIPPAELSPEEAAALDFLRKDSDAVAEGSD